MNLAYRANNLDRLCPQGEDDIPCMTEHKAISSLNSAWHKAAPACPPHPPYFRTGVLTFAIDDSAILHFMCQTIASGMFLIDHIKSK